MPAPTTLRQLIDKLQALMPAYADTEIGFLVPGYESELLIFKSVDYDAEDQAIVVEIE